jgi:O-Antigen ligase
MNSGNAVGLIADLIIIAGMSAMAFRHPSLGLAFLFLLMPLHTLTFNILKVDSGLSESIIVFLSMWKEFVIAALALNVVARVMSRGKLRITQPQFAFIVLAFILLGVIVVLYSPYLLPALYGFRGTFEPFFVLLLILALPLDSKLLERLLMGAIGTGVLISLFAIYEVFLLGFEFVFHYYAIGGVLSTSFGFMGGRFQRAMGTFASPNQFSLYLTYLITLVFNLYLRNKERKNQMFMLGAALIMVFALVLTVSRSGWFAAMAALFFSYLVWRRKGKLTLLVLTILFPFSILLVGLGLDQFLLSTVSLQEVSALGRIELTSYNIQTILQNPFGVGLGLVGARAGQLQGLPSRVTYATESYYLQLAMELGWLGLAMFCLITGFAGLLLYHQIYVLRSSVARGLTVAALACLLAACVHAFLIPDLQDITVGTYVWGLVAIAFRIASSEDAWATEPAKRPAPFFPKDQALVYDGS